MNKLLLSFFIISLLVPQLSLAQSKGRPARVYKLDKHDTTYQRLSGSFLSPDFRNALTRQTIGDTIISGDRFAFIFLKCGPGFKTRAKGLLSGSVQNAPSVKASIDSAIKHGYISMRLDSLVAFPVSGQFNRLWPTYSKNAEKVDVALRKKTVNSHDTLFGPKYSFKLIKPGANWNSRLYGLLGDEVQKAPNAKAAMDSAIKYGYISAWADRIQIFCNDGTCNFIWPRVIDIPKPCPGDSPRLEDPRGLREDDKGSPKGNSQGSRPEYNGPQALQKEKPCTDRLEKMEKRPNCTKIERAFPR